MTTTPAKPRVLFLCTGNSCRSQMAEGWAKHVLGDSAEVLSAGVETHGLNPNAVQVMQEAGVDIDPAKRTRQRSPARRPDLVISVCPHALEQPDLPANTRHEHVPFDDPQKLAKELEGDSMLAPYRRVCSEIKTFAEERLPTGENPVASAITFWLPKKAKKRQLNRPKSIIRTWKGIGNYVPIPFRVF